LSWLSCPQTACGMLRGLLLVLLRLPRCTAVDASTLTQERVLVITRHGIRVPYPPLKGLDWNVYSTDDGRDWFTNFKDWGADQVAGLTDHGQKVIREMGAFFKETLLRDAKGGYTIYSAVDDTQRDIKTAINFFKGAYPQDNVTVNDMVGNRSEFERQYVKALLNQGDFDADSRCPTSATIRGVIEGATGGDLAYVSTEQRRNIMAVNEALACCKKELCVHQGNSSFGDECTLMSLPTEWEGQQLYWEDFTGPLTVSAKLMEFIQLLYLNGMDYTKIVPNMSEVDIASLMRLHAESMGIPDDYWNSRNAASELFVHVAATMLQTVTGKDIAGLKSRTSDSLVYYAAHDINIYLLRRFLRLNWMTSSFNPNQSPPGGMLIFVLYSTPRGAEGKDYFVKAFFMTQSMRQQREASTLSEEDPASRVFAIMPGCADGPELSCPFDDFKRLVLSQIKAECVQLVDPQVLVDDSGGSVVHAWLIPLTVGVASLIVGLALGALISRRRSARTITNEMGTSLAQAS